MASSRNCNEYVRKAGETEKEKEKKESIVGKMKLYNSLRE
jgi:hypothetical protein